MTIELELERRLDTAFDGGEDLSEGLDSSSPSKAKRFCDMTFFGIHMVLVGIFFFTLQVTWLILRRKIIRAYMRVFFFSFFEQPSKVRLSESKKREIMRDCFLRLFGLL